MTDVVIVGAGVVGLATAWRSLTAGLTVVIVDPAPGSKASHASAGMLPPLNELLVDDEPLLRLCLASRERYRSFVAELEEDSGMSAGFRGDGLLDVAFTADDVAALDALGRFARSREIRCESLSSEQCRDLEPALAPSVAGGLLAPDDGAVNPRQLNAALLAAIRRRGGDVRQAEVTEVLLDRHATGVRLRGGDTVRGDRVVLAAGCWTHRLGGLPPGTVPEVRPVKGQILRLHARPPLLGMATRATVGGSAVYLVPRSDGELVVGATYEEAGYDTTPTVAGLTELLGRVRHVLPGAGRLAFAEFGAGLRPGSPDDLPMIGHTAVRGLLLATGHFRIGVQLAPITADTMTEMLITGETPELVKPFSPLRFS
ncbi:glycine oxidase ThiO [Nonomuraea sp. NPDC048916]|uniref:glycine oxidase ThiO n=1 Tax=Nonomuraea sp. NPDC048916 TaxID=3154232 RepID=UPI0033C9065F